MIDHPCVATALTVYGIETQHSQEAREEEI